MKAIKAITLHQPWASLIALGGKQFETRSWATTYRGLLIIHAGKTPFDQPPWYDERDAPFWNALHRVGIVDTKKLPLGAAVCVCELTAMCRTEQWRSHVSEQERAFGDWSDGRVAWKLENVQRFEYPIYCKGAQGLWDWTLPLPLGVTI